MKDKYLIIYENSCCVLRKEIVTENDLSFWIDKIIHERQGTVLSINKILVTA